MKKIICVSVLFLLSGAIQIFAQNHNDSIEIKKTLGTVYLQKGKRLTPKQLMNITKANPEAYEEMKVAKTNYDVSVIFGFAGGFLVGWPLGTAIAGGDPEWTLAGVGAGLIIVSIPFTASYNKHARNAVNLYNHSLSQTGLYDINFNIGLTNNGITIRMLF